MTRSVLARLRRCADRARDEDQTFEVETIHPGEIVATIAIGNAHVREVGLQRRKTFRAARQPFGGAQDSDVVPHHVVKPPPHPIEVTGRLAERRHRARQRRLDRRAFRFR